MSDQRRKGGGSGRGAGGGSRGSGKGGRGNRKNAKGAGRGQRQGGNTAGKGGRPVDDRVAELAGPLAKVLDRLPETQRRVLEHRMGLVDGHPMSLSDTANALGITPHEAKQIEQRAFEHIREVVPLDRLTKLMKGS